MFSQLQIKAQAEQERRRRDRDRRAEEDNAPLVDVVTTDYTVYQEHPRRFGVELFREHYTDDVVNVMHSVRDNPVTVARSANAVGKTHGAARIAAWFFKSFPDSQVYTTAAPPERNLKMLLWGEIGSLVRKHPRVFEQDSVSSLNIVRSPQSFITGVTIPMAGTPEQREAKFSGKHAPNLLFIVDEGDAVPNEVYRGIESCMSGGNARLLIMFNPRGQYGPVYNMERDRQANIVQLSAFRHPNVLTGENIIPGAVDREKTVRRINQWSRPLAGDERPDAECFEIPDFLVGAEARALSGEMLPPLPAGWRKITNPSFSYMVLGEYPSIGETQLISQSWIDAAVSRWLTYVATYGERPPVDWGIMGLDVAEYGKDYNVACLRYGNFIAKFDNRWKGVDPDTTAIKAAGIMEFKRIRLALVDATGVGAGVAPRITRLGHEAEGIKVAAAPTYDAEEGAFFQLRDQLWWMVREWLRLDKGAMLPPDEEIQDELKTPTYAIINGKIRISDKDTMRELLGRSPDKADALCMTFAEDLAGGSFYGTSPTTGYRG